MQALSHYLVLMLHMRSNLCTNVGASPVGAPTACADCHTGANPSAGNYTGGCSMAPPPAPTPAPRPTPGGNAGNTGGGHSMGHRRDDDRGQMRRGRDDDDRGRFRRHDRGD